MARGLIATLGGVTLTVRGAFGRLRQAVPARIASSRGQAQSQATELRRRMGQTVDQLADVLEEARQLVAERAADETRADLRDPFARASSESIRRRLEARDVRGSLERAGGEAADRVEQILLQGVRGRTDPDEVLEQVLKTVGGGEKPGGLEARSLMVARTELVSAERAGIFAAMEADSSAGLWVWNCSETSQVCPYCWVMHHTVHPASERMASHPNCKCFPSVYVPGATYTSGADLFAELDPAEQRQVLGPAAYEAYRTGLITLQDLRATSVDPELGPIGGTASLSSIVGRDEMLELLQDGLRLRR